jgi:hypothetical protein
MGKASGAPILAAVTQLVIMKRLTQRSQESQPAENGVRPNIGLRSGMKFLPFWQLVVADMWSRNISTDEGFEIRSLDPDIGLSAAPHGTYNEY